MATNRMQIRVDGMNCPACEARVVAALSSLPGVASARAWHGSARAEITFRPGSPPPGMEGLGRALAEAGYRLSGTVEEGAQARDALLPLAIILAIIAIWASLKAVAGIDLLFLLPRIDAGLSLPALFMAGLLTGFHCVAMCGAINLRASAGSAGAAANGSESPLGRLARPLLYQGGRTLSYAALGALAGGLGAVLDLSPSARAILLAICAAAMLLMGAGMLGILPRWLSGLTPRLPPFLSRLASRAASPFTIGLLNGLMPCGPLQAMQIWALGSGSAARGALGMTLFALGTVPATFAFGAFLSVWRKPAAAKLIRLAGGALVVLLGLGMGTRALNAQALGPSPGPGGAAIALAGPASTLPGGESAVPPASPPPSTEPSPTTVPSVGAVGLPSPSAPGASSVSAPPPSPPPVARQEAMVKVGPRSYSTVSLVAGVPAVVDFFVASERDLNGCNEAIVIPALGARFRLRPGHNRIEFTPTRAGRISYSCWMGMIPGAMTVLPPGGEGGDR